MWRHVRNHRERGGFARFFRFTRPSERVSWTGVSPWNEKRFAVANIGEWEDWGRGQNKSKMWRSYMEKSQSTFDVFTSSGLKRESSSSSYSSYSTYFSYTKSSSSSCIYIYIYIYWWPVGYVYRYVVAEPEDKIIMLTRGNLDPWINFPGFGCGCRLWEGSKEADNVYDANTSLV